MKHAWKTKRRIKCNRTVQSQIGYPGQNTSLHPICRKEQACCYHFHYGSKSLPLKLKGVFQFHFEWNQNEKQSFCHTHSGHLVSHHQKPGPILEANTLPLGPAGASNMWLAKFLWAFWYSEANDLSSQFGSQTDNCHVFRLSIKGLHQLW